MRQFTYPLAMALLFGACSGPEVHEAEVITKNPARVKFTSNAKGLDVTTRRLKAVERFRMVAMVKHLEALVRANAKKAGFKTR